MPFRGGEILIGPEPPPENFNCTFSGMDRDEVNGQYACDLRPCHAGFDGWPALLRSHAQDATEIGGQKIVTLTRTAVSTTKPEFTSVTLAPGRGMEILQITANFPGKGNVDVLASPDLASAKKMLDVDDDDFGNLGYRLGAAFLAPYPNRIRGKLSADGKTLTTEWEGHTITLPANNIGHLPTAERHAMHGLILKAKTDDVSVENVPGGQEVSGVIHAGDFGGHWLSKTQFVITIRLTAESVDATIEARNVGTETEPMAIAWHPYFNLPSGDRTQARRADSRCHGGRGRRLRQRLPHRQDCARRGNQIRPAQRERSAAGNRTSTTTTGTT